MSVIRYPAVQHYKIFAGNNLTVSDDFTLNDSPVKHGLNLLVINAEADTEVTMECASGDADVIMTLTLRIPLEDRYAARVRSLHLPPVTIPSAAFELGAGDFLTEEPK